MRRLTKEWVSKAEADWRAARKLAPGRPPTHDLVCFCCQQTAEKYLKALLEEQGLEVPRTHDLNDLLNRLLPLYPRLPPLRRGCKLLNRFAVNARYPGFRTRKRQVRAALNWAGRVREAARALLGLRIRKTRP